MDILFADNCSAVPPVEFHTIGWDDWVALNVSAAMIPIEALVGTTFIIKIRQLPMGHCV